MCELMGLSFSEPVSAAFSLQAFGSRDDENPDGWGLAWYPDRSAAVVKEPVSWRSSQHVSFLEAYTGLRSTVYIAHVRHKTVGDLPCHADTHPFLRELSGREYCFAHNGTLTNTEGLMSTRFQPLGSTDSEKAFCYLLEELARRQMALDQPDGWKELHQLLMAVNELGKFNCLMSDGQRLFCYFDANGHKGLHFRRIRLAHYETRAFRDQELQVEVEGETTTAGIAVASCALSETGWHSFLPGEMLVLERGDIRFSTARGTP